MKTKVALSLMAVMASVSGACTSEKSGQDSGYLVSKSAKSKQSKPIAVFDYSKFGHSVRFKRLKNEFVFSTPKVATFYSVTDPAAAPTRKLDLKLPKMAKTTVVEIVEELAKNQFITLTDGYEDGVPVAEKVIKVYNAATKTTLDLGKKLINCLTVFGEESCSPVPIGQISVEGSRIFVAAGAAPNLLYTDDMGENWSAVNGNYPVTNTMCYGASFLRTKTHLVQGGECPLDQAFVKIYKFTDESRTKIALKPVASVDHKFMGNRAAWNVFSNPETNQVFAGVEGGLIELVGETFSPVFRIEHAISGSNGIYPYYDGIAHVQGQPAKMLAWGNSRETGGTVMATTDGGKTWTNITTKAIAEKAGTERIKDVYFDASKSRFLITVSPDEYADSPAPMIYSVYEYKM